MQKSMKTKDNYKPTFWRHPSLTFKTTPILYTYFVHGYIFTCDCYYKKVLALF